MKPRLLIIDDDANYCELLAIMLVDFDLDMAGTLGEGLERLANSTYACTLLDLGLSDSIPTRTFSIFKEHFPEAPVVIVTANDDPSSITGHLKLSASGYIVKGRNDNPQSLGAAIRAAINDHRSGQKLETATETLSRAPMPKNE